MQTLTDKLPAILLIILAGTIASYPQTDLSPPRHYVEDYANVINPSDEQALNAILQELEQKTCLLYTSPSPRD